MAEKLYLIRVNLERFIGPMPLKEVKVRYKKMEFGLQDEIAASNKSWVAFDEFDKIKKLYPELADLVKKEMLAGWGGVTLTPARIPDSPASYGQNSRFLPGILGKLLLVLMTLIVALFAYNMARNEEFASRLFSLRDPNPVKANELLGEARNARHEAYMDRYLKDILPQIRKKKSYDDWIPHLRVIAFSREGRIDGLRNSYLKGKKGLPAPKDCSVASWKMRWKRSIPYWESFLDGKLLNSSDWSRLLVWDPDWIQRRSPFEGWVDPGSYFQGCLAMALKAIQSLDKETLGTSAEIRDVLASRMRWQLKMIRGEAVGEEYTMSGSLWALSCLEGSERLESLEECQSSLDLGTDWRTLIRGRLALAQARMLIMQGDPMTQETLVNLQHAMEMIPSRDFVTRFDYVPEIHFFQSIIANGGSISKALKMNDEKGVEIHFN